MYTDGPGFTDMVIQVYRYEFSMISKEENRTFQELAQMIYYVWKTIPFIHELHTSSEVSKIQEVIIKD
jgi:hypothetical protein